MMNDEIIARLNQVVNTSQTDNNAGLLNEKLIAGDNITLTVVAAPDGSETLVVAAGAPAAVLIEEKVFNATDSFTFDFENIPQTFKDLRLELSVRSNDAAAFDALLLRAGTGGVVDTGSNYRANLSIIDGAGTVTASWTNANTRIVLDNLNAANATAGRFGSYSLLIRDYTEAKDKEIIGQFDSNGSALATGALNTVVSGAWKNAVDPIDTLRLLTNNGLFLAGTTFRLYGIN